VARRAVELVLRQRRRPRENHQECGEKQEVNRTSHGPFPFWCVRAFNKA
jgi:hypothetical protein